VNDQIGRAKEPKGGFPMSLKGFGEEFDKLP